MKLPAARDRLAVLELGDRGDVGDLHGPGRDARDVHVALAVELDLVDGGLELVRGHVEQRLAGLDGRRDHGVADPVGRPAGERAHVVRTGVGVGGVDEDGLERDAERLGRDLADDGPQPLAEVRRRERDDEIAAGRGVDQRLRRVAAEVHAGRVVDGGHARAAQLGHVRGLHRVAPSVPRGAEVIAANSAGSSCPTSAAAACIVSMRVASSTSLRCGFMSPSW